MSLFHTGFNVDAAVPVASTSTTAHPSAGSVHKKRKRATSAGADDEKSKTAAESAVGATVTPAASNPAAGSAAKKSSVMISADVDMSLSDPKNNSSSSSKSTEAVVNIEKLMKKLQRMEKGEKATKEEEKIAKKQKLQANGRDHATPARGSNSIITTKNDKGKGKDATAEGSKKAKAKKDKKEKESRPEYIPDAEALAKREARIKKKELHALTADEHKKKKKEASSANPDSKTADEEGAEQADASTMDIDTLEEVAQNAPPLTTTEPEEAQADTPAAPAEKTTKKKNKKKAAEPEATPEEAVKSESLSEVASTPVPTAKAKVALAAAAPAPVIATPAAAKSTKEADAGMTDLQKRMQKKLGGARFRWINEQLYTTSGVDALQLMEEDPAMFEDYHNGFASQATSWPTQPIHLFIDQFKRLAASKASTPKPVIADLGCGKAEIAQTLVPLGFTVLSYDLVEEEPYIIKAQCTKRLPLPGSGKTNPKDDNAEGAVVDHVVCCLSLMGNDWLGMIREARRVLKMNGKLKIAEVTSRFTDVKDFIQLINAMGFKLGSKDDSNTHFIIFEFEKIPLQTCKSSLLTLSDEEKIAASQDLLKPCIYKRR